MTRTLTEIFLHQSLHLPGAARVPGSVRRLRQPILDTSRARAKGNASRVPTLVDYPKAKEVGIRYADREVVVPYSACVRTYTIGEVNTADSSGSR